MRRSRRIAGLFALTVALALAGLQAIPAAADHGGDAEVTVGSVDTVFSQNKQNEPAVAIDPANPWLVAAGANDNIDMEGCNVGPDNTCPFTNDVGGSGVQFSFDSGDSWMQPEYTGLTARHCLGVGGTDTDTCAVQQGPIGTLPHYDDAGLVSDGDPAVVFGPIPGQDGTFSWTNGSRLYYANLTSEQVASDIDAFRGFEAIAVSRLDLPPGLDETTVEGVVTDEANWHDPVIVSKQSATTFSDKEQIWVDQNQDSPFFGHAYVCWASFRSLSGGNALPTPLKVATSTDGGETWRDRQVTDATNNPFNQNKGFGRSGCTIRTDADGVVYVFANQFAVGLPGEGKHIMIRSFDGGRRWTRPVELFTAVDTCFAVQFDGAGFRCVMDGVAGARDDLSSSPSLDVAPDTGYLYDVWVDGRAGSAGPPVDNATDVRLAFAHADDAGSPDAWAVSEVTTPTTDRPYYAAIALSPDGTDAYLVYNAFTTPYRNDTTTPRGLVGVVMHAEVDPVTGAPGTFSEVYRGPAGDPRASAQNNLVLEFLGDYVYADATNDYGVAVWNDTRQAEPCEAVNVWRAEVQETLDPSGAPAVEHDDCPEAPRFGNSDIWSWSGTG